MTPSKESAEDDYDPGKTVLTGTQIHQVCLEQHVDGGSSDGKLSRSETKKMISEKRYRL